MRFITASIIKDRCIETSHVLVDFNIFARSSIKTAIDEVIQETISRVFDSESNIETQRTYITTFLILQNYCLSFMLFDIHRKELAILIGETNSVNNTMKLTISKLLRRIINFDTDKDLAEFLTYINDDVNFQTEIEKIDIVNSKIADTKSVVIESFDKLFARNELL